MTGEKAAPAEMPGVEEIARATAIRITDAILDHVYVDGENVSASVLHPAAEIIADILAPILAEKERAERERCALIAEAIEDQALDEAYANRYDVDVYEQGKAKGAKLIAAAIRAQGE